MAYTKITLEVVVHEVDLETATQAMNDVLESVEEKQKLTIYFSDIRTAETGEPENAAEIGAPV